MVNGVCIVTSGGVSRGAEVIGAPNLGLFDDPLAYPGFGLGENMIFPNYESKFFFPAEHKF